MQPLTHFIKSDNHSHNDLDQTVPCKKCYKPTYTLYPGKICGDCYEAQVKGGTK